MQFPGKDGKSYGSQMQASQAKPPAAAPTDAPDDSKPPITDNPAAMQLVDQLKQMGYTADDVEEAMGGSEEQEMGGKAAPAAPPMSMPGLQ